MHICQRFDRTAVANSRLFSLSMSTNLKYWIIFCSECIFVGTRTLNIYYKFPVLLLNEIFFCQRVASIASKLCLLIINKVQSLQEVVCCAQR